MGDKLKARAEALHSYDEKCYELAQHFLHDSRPEVRPIVAKELAQQIQDCVEDCLRVLETAP